MRSWHLEIKATSTSPDLRFGVRFDQSDLSSHKQEDHLVFRHRFNGNSNKIYRIELIMQGKLPSHTKLDNDLQVIKDHVIEIHDVMLDQFNVTSALFQKSVYHHNNNDFTDPCESRFYGVMGYNGRVIADILGPIDLWLLENT